VDDDDGQSKLHWRTKALEREGVVEIEAAAVDDDVADATAVVLGRMDRRMNAVVAADIIVAAVRYETRVLSLDHRSQ
jgi:hypothetical protein